MFKLLINGQSVGTFRDRQAVKREAKQYNYLQKCEIIEI